MLPNTHQSTGQSPTQRFSHSKVSILPRVRNPTVNNKFSTELSMAVIGGMQAHCPVQIPNLHRITLQFSCKGKTTIYLLNTTEIKKNNKIKSKYNNEKKRGLYSKSHSLFLGYPFHRTLRSCFLKKVGLIE